MSWSVPETGRVHGKMRSVGCHCAGSRSRAWVVMTLEIGERVMACLRGRTSSRHLERDPAVRSREGEFVQ